MRKLKIDIIGAPNTGKSTTAHLIKAQLEEVLGAKVEIKDIDAEGTPLGLELVRRGLKLDDLEVLVQVHQTRRPMKSGVDVWADMPLREFVLEALHNAQAQVNAFLGPGDEIGQMTFMQIKRAMQRVKDEF